MPGHLQPLHTLLVGHGSIQADAPDKLCDMQQQQLMGAGLKKAEELARQFLANDLDGLPKSVVVLLLRR